MRLELLDLLCVRVPLLSLEESVGRLWGARSEEDGLQRLSKVLELPEVIEALWVSKPLLAREIDAHRPLTAEVLRTKLGSRIRTLYRFATRVGSRPSPIGTSAGVAAGSVKAGPAHLSLGARSTWRKQARPDSALESHAWNLALASQAVEQRLRWRLNPTAALGRRHLSYIQSVLPPGAEPRSVQSCLDLSPALEAVAKAAGSWCSLSSLEKALESVVTDANERAHIQSFLFGLIRQQVLVPDTTPGMILRDEAPVLSRRLKKVAPTSKADSLLTPVEKAADLLEETVPGEGVEIYRQMHEQLDGRLLTTGRHFLPLDLRLQVDLHVAAPELQFSSDWTRDLQKASLVLSALWGKYLGSPELLPLMDQFRERYGQAVVPLVEVFDPQIGLRWPSAAKFALNSENSFDLRALQEMMRKTDPGLDARKSREPWVIDLAKVSLPRQERNPLPRHLTLTGSAITTEAGEVFHLKWINGASGLRILGRFTQGDIALKEQALAVIAEEKRSRPDAIFADMIYYGRHRAKNFSARPALYDHFIQLAPDASPEMDHAIRVEDLTLQLEGNRFALRCPRLNNREVIPRLLTAQNFSEFDNPYAKFMAYQQEPDHPVGIMWGWQHLRGARRLPRITVGRITLTFQEWNLPREEVKRLSDPKFRATLGIPSKVKICRGDREIPCDLDDPFCFGNLIEDHEGDSTCIREWPYLSPSPVRGPEGGYVNEVVLAARTEAPAPAQTGVVLRTESRPPLGWTQPDPTHRLQAPGGDWTYLKLALNWESMDSFLVNELLPFARDMEASTREFFFIRYADPDTHLRIRFRRHEGDRSSKLAEHAMAWATELLHSRRIRDLNLGTYARESERYGGAAAIETVESIFSADSRAALDWLEFEANEPTLNQTGWPLASWRKTERLLFALWGIDRTLQLAGLNLDERARWAGMYSGYRGRPVQPQVKDALAGLMRNCFQDPNWIFSNRHGLRMFTILRRRDALMRPRFAALRALRDQGQFEGNWNDFLASITHMQLNRLRCFDQNPIEAGVEPDLYSLMRRIHVRQQHRGALPPGTRSNGDSGETGAEDSVTQSTP